MNVHENKLPMKQSVRGVYELLGLEALNFTTKENCFMVSQKKPGITLHQHTLGKDACTIGIPRIPNVIFD